MAKHPFVFILGMHRSGTSCLAGALEQCGLHLGDVRRSGVYNPKGYFELESVQRMHDQILGLNGGSWHEPPDQVRVHPYHQEQIRLCVEKLSERRPCGVKDPRLLLMLDDWLNITAAPTMFVGTFRHPLAVAESLHHRNGMDKEKAIDLWLTYNTALVERHRLKWFPLVEYNLHASGEYQTQVEFVARTLGLSPDSEKLSEFITPDLQNFELSDQPVPRRCEAIWNDLREPLTIRKAMTQQSNSPETPSTNACSPLMKKSLEPDALKTFLMFIGNPRSGTTITRSLINAHPRAVVSNEANLLPRIEQGASWAQVLVKILANVQGFDRHSTWNGYSYAVPESANSQAETQAIQLIGDKKAARTTTLLREDPTQLETLQQFAPAPLKFLHCVRAPLDVITTSVKRTGWPLDANLNRYFDLEETAAEIEKRLPGQVFRLYHESLIYEPRTTLCELLNFLELPVEEEYLQACQSILRTEPNHSRYQMTWPEASLEEVEERTKRQPHLHHYLNQGLPRPEITSSDAA